MDSLTNSILSAIDIVVDKRIKEAAYDKAMVAQIVDIIDTVKGKYKISLQDSITEALTLQKDASYDIGDNVYVLVPNNDTTQDRIILCATPSSRSISDWEKSIINKPVFSS